MESERRITLNICLYGKFSLIISFVRVSVDPFAVLLGSHLFLSFIGLFKSELVQLPIDSHQNARRISDFHVIQTEIARRHRNLRHRG